jgi:hypothetical protein
MRAFAGRHVFVLASSSGLRGHNRTYLTILESADHALFKMVRYVLLRPLRPELDAKTKTCLPVFLVSHKSPILEMDLGRLALASEFTGGHTLPKKEHGLPILKWYGMSSCNLSFRHSY